jgi:hypothetical protein
MLGDVDFVLIYYIYEEEPVWVVVPGYPVITDSLSYVFSISFDTIRKKSWQI